MPISGQGWEILIERTHVQRRADGRVRTVGRYQVFHDNIAVTTLAGTTAESPGPGSNEIEGSGKRVAAGRYPLFTHAGPKYVTLNFAASQNLAALPRPALGLENTSHRSAILIHPESGSWRRAAASISARAFRMPPKRSISSAAGSASSRSSTILPISSARTFPWKTINSLIEPSPQSMENHSPRVASNYCRLGGN